MPLARTTYDKVGNLHSGPSAVARLPEVLPAGVLPGEQSKMWKFTPEAIQRGESMIGDDTREWFADREFKLEVKREYPDHPRWMLTSKHPKQRNSHNGNLVSEVHMLIRTHAGLAPYPDWVGARMAIKAIQSDISYRLAKLARGSLIKHGEEAFQALATRAPAQFIKLLSQTFVPKKIEVEHNDGTGLEPSERTMLLKALADELKRREDAAYQLATTDVMDYEPQNTDGLAVIGELGQQFGDAAADRSVGQSKVEDGEVRSEMAYGVRQVKNLIDIDEAEAAIYAAEGKGPASVFDWED